MQLVIFLSIFNALYMYLKIWCNDKRENILGLHGEWTKKVKKKTSPRCLRLRPCHAASACDPRFLVSLLLSHAADASSPPGGGHVLPLCPLRRRLRSASCARPLLLLRPMAWLAPPNRQHPCSSSPAVVRSATGSGDGRRRRTRTQPPLAWTVRPRWSSSSS
jgi:hypothetical protein